MNMLRRFSHYYVNPIFRGCVSKSYSSHGKSTKTSYSFMPGEINFLPYTLGDIVDHAATDAGDVPAFVFPSQSIRKTFLDFHDEVNKLASGFVSLGLAKGDRLAVCAPNVYEWPVSLFAAAKAGLIVVNINPANQASEMEYCLNKAGCKALVVSDSFKTQDYYKLLCSFIPELSSSKPGDLVSEKVKTLKSVIFIGNNKAKSGTMLFNDVMNAGDTRSSEKLNSLCNLIQFDQPVNIQFTSGTTGQPKGATLSHFNLVNNALLIGKILNYHVQKPVVCCLVPFFHSFGCVIGLIASTLYQNTLVSPSPGYDGDETIKVIQQERCTASYGAPTMFVDVLNRYSPSQHDLSSLFQIVSGGAPCPQDLFIQLKEKLQIPNLHNGYGTTETSPAIAAGGMNLSMEKVLSGYVTPLQNVEIKIIDNKGKTLPCGEQGEICVRGHNVFLGYWNNKEGTAQAIDKARWYHTGDLGQMNEEGDIKINGRLKDMVIRGGENLYPVEIENFLQKHPSILEVYVCGVPDKVMGEELCAWVHLKAGETLTEEGLKEYCKNQISHFKIPRYILFVDNFPKLASGKVQKFVMTSVSKAKLGL